MMIMMMNIVGIMIIIINDQGDRWWGAATIAAVCLPGLLGDKSFFTSSIWFIWHQLASFIMVVLIICWDHHHLAAIIVIDIDPVAWLLDHAVF